MNTGNESQRFLPKGALAEEAEKVRGMPALATLSVAIEDQSNNTFGDLYWAVRQLLINLGAVSIATHIRNLGAGKVDAYYPVMKGVRIESQYDLIGLSSSEVSLASCVERIGELRRKLGDHPLIIVGGPGMDNWWEFVLKAGANGVVIADGQYPVTKLLGLLLPRMADTTTTLRGAYQAACEAGELASIKDLAFIDSSGATKRNPPQAFVRDLDEYAPVDYSLIRGGLAGSKIKCMHYSSGCVFACEFCSSIVNQRHCYRHVSVGRLLDEMETAQREGFTELSLASDLMLPGNANHNRRLLEELRQGRKERGVTIKGSSQTTVASLHNIIFKNTGTADEPRYEEDLEGIKLLKDAGMTRWGLGVEAFTDAERERLGKDKRQAGSDSQRTLTTLCRHGFSIHAMMMVHEDTPYERCLEIGRILADVGAESTQFFHPVPAPQTPWGAEMFKRTEFLIGNVGGERQGASRCTGEYVVASYKPQKALIAVDACYRSFTSPGSIARDVLRGRFWNALTKLGMRFLIFSRRVLVPQFYLYDIAILEGNYRYFKAGVDEVWPGSPLTAMGGMRPSLRLLPLMARHRREVRALGSQEPKRLEGVTNAAETASK